MLDKKILDILVCPLCKATLNYSNNELICHKCKLAYPVIDDIPVMLIDEARELDNE